MVLFYIGQPTTTVPLADHTPTKQRRNEKILVQYAQGETIGCMALHSDISVPACFRFGDRISGRIATNKAIRAPDAMLREESINSPTGIINDHDRDAA